MGYRCTRLFRLGLLFVVLWSAPRGGVYGAWQDELDVARIAMQEQKWERAIRLLDGVIEAHPEHLEARYLRGICFGERGKIGSLQASLLGFLRKARKDFEFILARDSMYQDVLYQYALVHRYKEDFQDAIRIGHEQVRLKPELAHVQLGLYKFYWRYLVHTKNDKVRAWLQEQDTEYAAFFQGEVYQREEWYAAADNIYEDLLERPTSLSRTMVWLARARTQYATLRPDLAQGYIEQAVTSIRTRTDALFFFDDVKYIATPEEIQTFTEIENPAAYRAFFETFWVKRNPMPAAPVNERIAEHYRRLRYAEQYYVFYGFRAWYNSPYFHAGQGLPSTFTLSTDFDDRGVVYIRHGEPDDRTYSTMGPLAESWLYDDPRLLFHFMETTGPGGGIGRMVFTPTPQGPTFVDKYVGFDPLDTERKSMAYLNEGLVTDRHRWPERTEVMEMPYTVAAFRGEEGYTLVEVYYGVPIGSISRELAASVDTADVEVGMTVHDQVWRLAGFVRETRHLVPRDNRDALVFGRFQIDVPPDSYHVALHGRSLQQPLVASYKFDVLVPSYREAGLKMSDLLLADTILEISDAVPTSRQDLYLQVNPLGRFRTPDPVYVYFEVYDLDRTPDGRTRYSVTYTLSPEERGGLRGLLRGNDDGAISLSSRAQEGVLASPIEYVAVDVNDVPPGTYTLIVTVKDERTGAEVERSHTLELMSP